MQRPSSPPANVPLPETGAGPWPALVLVDGDEDMWLVRVRFPEPPRDGLTFGFKGERWQVERTAPYGCRAVPLVM